MQDIVDFFEAYRKPWSVNSADELASFWDTADAGPFYKAEEIDGVFTSWDELKAYWTHNEGFNEVNELSFSDHKSQELAPGLHIVSMRMRWDIKFAENARMMDGSAFTWAGKAMGGTNHVISLLRKTDDGYRICAWVEAPMAPISYIAELYMNNVRPDFPGAPGYQG